MKNSKTLIVAVWAVSIIAIIYLSLQPGEDIPTPFLHADKVGHFIAYGWLGFLPAVAFISRRALISSGGSMILLGALLELAQAYVPMRMTSLGDIAANTLGVLIGISLAAVLRRSAGCAQEK